MPSNTVFIQQTEISFPTTLKMLLSIEFGFPFGSSVTPKSKCKNLNLKLFKYHFERQIFVKLTQNNDLVGISRKMRQNSPFQCSFPERCFGKKGAAKFIFKFFLRSLTFVIACLEDHMSSR